MDVLPEFRLLRPTTIGEAAVVRAETPGSRLLGGGTDLIVNIRRDIGDPPSALIDINGVEELKRFEVGAQRVRIGAGVNIAELAHSDSLRARAPVLAEAGRLDRGAHPPQHGDGGWQSLPRHPLHLLQPERVVASRQRLLSQVPGHEVPRRPQEQDLLRDLQRGPRSRPPGARGDRAGYADHDAPGARSPAVGLGVLAPAVEIVSKSGRRWLPLGDLYTRDGRDYLALEPDELVASVGFDVDPRLRSGYDKVRVRRSIEYPVAGVAVALSYKGARLDSLRVGFTGTNPWPVLLEGTAALAGGALDEEVLSKLDGLVRRQIMAMRTTFTSGHYRRRVAGVLARRLIERLLER